MLSSVFSRILAAAGAAGAAAVAAVSGVFTSAPPPKPAVPTEVVRPNIDAQDVAKAEAARLAAVKAEAERLEAAKAEAVKLEAARAEAARLEAARADTVKQQAAKAEIARLEAEAIAAAKREAAKAEAVRQEAAKVDTAKRDAAAADAVKLEALKLEAAKQDAAKAETARQDAAKAEAAKTEAARLEAAKVEAAKQASAKVETARLEAAKIEAAKQTAVKLGAVINEVVAKQASTRKGTSKSTAAGGDMMLGGIAVKSWGYQLQNDDVETIANSPYDVIVMDYSRDTTTAGAFTPADLVRMKKKPDGSRRIVLSYISIGEAESYRYYWAERGWDRTANRASVVDEENPEWKGNYSVRYWLNEWQDVIVGDEDSYMNRINKAGFDGVYLDKIDVCEAYEGRTPSGTVASDLMIQFVRKMSAVMKTRNPNFLIIAQNAEFLLPDEDYRAAIDGIGKEDILYRNEKVPGTNRYQDGKSNDADSVKQTIDLVNKLRDDGKTVMAVEYITDRRSIETASDKLQGERYLFYVGPRDLARLAPPVLVASRDN
jgi:cysteinyl-tRNA synthetase, unknown class